MGTLADYKNNTGANTLFGAYRIIINKIRSLNADARIVLLTPMQRVDFVYKTNMQNNAYGSYKDKNGQSLSQFAAAVNSIGALEHLPVVDLYNKSGMTLKRLVKFKRLHDPQTGQYRNYPFPEFIGKQFDPAKDEYPYPAEAMDLTYDGLHPSDKGYAIITDMLVKVMKKLIVEG